MHRIVFLGLDGAFSTVILRALAYGGLRPWLVVQGLERKQAGARPVLRVHSSQPSLLDRFTQKLRPLEAPRVKHSLLEVARSLDIDLIQTQDVNTPRVQGLLAKLKPDALVVAGFTHLLSGRVLKSARFGGLNLHPGRLPAERGPSPLFWALKAGRTTVGYSLHVLNEREDAGDIVAEGELSFLPGTDGQEILKMCAEAAAPLVVRGLRGMLAGDLVRVPQRREGVGRAPRPKFRDGKIEVDRSAEAVFTFVGGCAKSYSLFAECGGDRFFIRRAVSFDSEGRLDFEYALMGDRLLLRCAPGVVELELKEEGALFSAEYED